MTIEISVNVLAHPREPFNLRKYREANVYANYNCDDNGCHTDTYSFGGQVSAYHSVLDMEVSADIQRAYSKTTAVERVCTAAFVDVPDPDRRMTNMQVAVATTDVNAASANTFSTGAHFTILP